MERRDNSQSEQERTSQLNLEVEQLRGSIAERVSQGNTDGYAGLYATLSDKYIELHRLNKDHYYAFDWSMESLNKAVEMAGDSDLQYLAKRVERYIDAYNLVEAERDLATLRKALSKRPNPAVSSANRAYLRESRCQIEAVSGNRRCARRNRPDEAWDG